MKHVVRWRRKRIEVEIPTITANIPLDIAHFAYIGLKLAYEREVKRLIDHKSKPSVAAIMEKMVTFRPSVPDPLAKLKRKPWKDLTAAEKQAIRESEK